MTIRRRTLLTGLAATSLAVLGACSPTGDETPVASEGTPPVDTASSAAPTAVTVGLTYIPNVQFSPFYVGLANGIFDDLGLDLTLRHHGAQEDMFGALIQGNEQVVFASADEGVVAGVQTPGLRTFATAYQTFPGVAIAPAGSGVRDLADLRGRSIGIPGHFGSTYYAALVALHQGGLTEGEVNLMDIGYTQVAALTGGRVESIVGYSNNDAVQCRLAGLDIVELPVQDPADPTLVGPGLLTLEGTLDDETLAAIAQGMLEAERLIVGDPALAIEATRQHVPTLSDPAQQEAAEAVLEATMKLWLRDGEPSVAVDTEAFERMGEFLVEAGIIDHAPAETYLVV